MNLFDIMKKTDCKEVLFFNEPMVSLKAIIAINNTILGPAVCNCKVCDYNEFNDAINDAINIAAYGTYSAALTRRDLGGGSIVIWASPETVKNEMLFRALGAFINKLSGKVFVTNASGVSTEDLLDVKRESEYVLGLPKVYGGSGDTSVSTAKGVVWGLKAAVKELIGEGSLKDIRISLQGVGKVGGKILEDLVDEGAILTVTDIIYDRVKNIQDRYPNITCVRPEDIYKSPCDLFCPCAHDNMIDDDAIDQLQCKIIAGASNNCLFSDSQFEKLRKRGMWMIPGFVINSGEIIQVSNELLGYGYEKTEKELSSIYDITTGIIQKAKDKKLPATVVALNEAYEYTNNVSKIKMIK